MPHLIIETNLSELPAGYVENLHHQMQQSGLFKPADVKTRVYQPAQAVIGVDGRGLFIHATIRLMEGRTDEQKQVLADTIFSAIQQGQSDNVYLSLEIADMEKSPYRKYVPTI